MNKQRKYSEDMDAKNHINLRFEDLWHAIYEIQKAIRFIIPIAFIVTMIFEALIKVCINQVGKFLIYVRN